MAKKMVLMDPRLLPSPPVPDPVPDVLRRLDGDMESILRNQSLHAAEKVARYNEVLNDYLNKTREYRNLQRDGGLSTPRPRLPTVPDSESMDSHGVVSAASGDKGLDENVYIDMFPKSYQGKALRMLKFLKQLPKVNWTERGELKVGNQVYENSHIVDLVNSSVKPHVHKGRVADRPVGWEAFSRALSESNVPQNLLSSTVKRDLVVPKPKAESSSDEENPSGRVSRSRRRRGPPLRWSPLERIVGSHRK